MPPDEVPALSFTSAAHWQRWLETEHATSGGVWLKIARKGGAEAGISYPEALLEALCFGWIDGQKRGLDANHWPPRFRPRQPSGPAAEIHPGQAQAPDPAGRKRPGGQREVDA